MSKPSVRMIARLDVKNNTVVKGIHLEGLRVVGTPTEMAVDYYHQGADEILYMDAVASLYNRNSLIPIVEQTSRAVFVPMTVGGGIRTLEDIQALLRAGADKVAINTAAINDPDFIKRAAKKYGSQCIVLSIEAIKLQNRWEAYIETGRQATGIDAIEWAQRGVELGAGEILLTSIGHEGMKKGFDLELTNIIAKKVQVPVIACGGAGTAGHIADAIQKGEADAVAFASILHYRIESMQNIKKTLSEKNIPVRIL